ncbi:MAG: exodeoxyribonuclease VII large subunit [Candidatus Omnitrophota bacterium]
MQKNKLEQYGPASNSRSHKLKGYGSVSGEREAGHVYTVSEITQKIKTLLEEKVGEVWVEGEISNFNSGPNGHFYFSLKDQSCIIKAAMFFYANRGLKFKLENGLKVLCFGKVNVYGPHGQYQIVVERVELKGIGAQQLAFEQLKKKLAQEGLFDQAHKRPLPLMPFSVGIVTSAKGAAVRDILQILKKGAPCVDALIRSVRVQGEYAAGEICSAIEELNSFGGVDLIIVSRGGGSSEDLWSFNEEAVARAVYGSRIPVISAVGHQINTTLSDLAADIFVETPSAAAKIIVDRKNALLSEIADWKHSLDFSMKNAINGLGADLIALKHALKSPADRLLEKQQFLDELLAGLNYNIRHSLELAKERSSSLIQRLGVLSPLAVLSRGYSLSMIIPKEEILKESSQLKAGDRLKTVLHRGSFTSIVQEVFRDEGKTGI